MTTKIDGPVDHQQNEVQNAVGHRLPTAPSSPALGQKYYNTTSNKEFLWDGTTWIDLTAGDGAGIGDVLGPASSVDSEVALFSGVTGKQIKRATGSGLAKLTNGVLGVAVEGPGNDYLDGATTLDELGAPVVDVPMGGQKITGLGAGSASDDAVNKSQLDAAVQGVRWKAPARAATTADVALATGLENGDTIDGVVLATGDRVLVKDQADATQNGLYVVQAAGAPVRAVDADAGAEIVAMVVAIEEGTANADRAFQCTNDDVTVGSTSIVFVDFHTTNVPDASTTVKGKVELATAAEAEAKAAADVVVTPVGLASFTRKYAENIGDAAATSFVVTHNLGTLDVSVTVYENATGDEVIVGRQRTSLNTVTIGVFGSAPAADEYRVVVVG